MEFSKSSKRTQITFLFLKTGIHLDFNYEIIVRFL